MYGKLPTRGDLLHRQLEVTGLLEDFLNPANQLSFLEEVFRLWRSRTYNST